jgi:hypothetical protein
MAWVAAYDYRAARATLTRARLTERMDEIAQVLGCHPVAAESFGIPWSASRYPLRVASDVRYQPSLFDEPELAFDPGFSSLRRIHLDASAWIDLAAVRRSRAGTSGTRSSLTTTPPSDSPTMKTSILADAGLLPS